jgi:ATP-dependent DNA helicase RecQ
MQHLDDIYQESLNILRKTLNDPNAQFRDGQFEAINAVFTNKRSLVVQKTGWGKSFVYFISTKINRNRGKGISIVISPLLVLIENQIEAAEKMNLKCEAIYSGNREQHLCIIDGMKQNKIDIVFTTPESLFNILREHLKDINLGMFIIDEAHCISDWGHDFRMDYRRIVEVLNELKNSDFPMLATTATANNRVIDDLKQQIGPSLYVSRGSLYRDNLNIQLIDLQSKINRYAWILNHINSFKGTGIIYCLTTRDCDRLTEFLKENSVDAISYHSQLDIDIADENIKRFVNNKVKVLVSTIKLGMGYDKPDVSFVIHYQVPKNIVSYYQQIGRAARNIESGNVIMLKGGNDFSILEYFIDNAFPEKKDMDIVLNVFDNLPWDKRSVSPQGIAQNINISFKRIHKALKFLEFENVLNREKQSYFLTGNKYVFNQKHYDEITEIRKHEIEELKSLFITRNCLNKEIIKALDDYSITKCGRCVNCLNKEVVSSQVDKKYLKIAEDFIENESIVIIPRDKMKSKVKGTGQYQYPDRYYNKGNYIPVQYIEKEMSKGVALSKYGDDGIGTTIGQCKYSNKSYPLEVYEKAKRILNPIIKEHKITHITFVPSLNNNLMDEFTKNLAILLFCR